jgi:hypothetical protein
MKFTYGMDKSFTNFRLFFHKASCTINIHFPPLRETMYAGRVKRFPEASELFMHAVFRSSSFAKRRPPSASFRGPKRDGGRRVLNRNCMEDVGEEIEGSDFCG